MKISLVALCFLFVASQVNLVTPRSRGNNRVYGSTVGVNACGNGSDVQLRASRTPVATYWHGGNATNISITFGNLDTYWTLSIVTYTNYTGPIDPNATLPLPITSQITTLRTAERVSTTTNTTGTYLLRDFQWPLSAAAACRPNYYGCALRVVTVNDASNDTSYTCSDIRVYSRSFDYRLVFTVRMNTGVVAPPPANMLSRLRLVYSVKVLTATNSEIEPGGATLTALSDGTYQFTVIISDMPGYTSDQVAAAITADRYTSLNNTLGVASVVLGNDQEPASKDGETAAIVITVLVLLIVIFALIYVKYKKPDTWQSWCDAITCCKPRKGTNI